MGGYAYVSRVHIYNNSEIYICVRMHSVSNYMNLEK